MTNRKSLISLFVGGMRDLVQNGFPSFSGLRHSRGLKHLQEEADMHRIYLSFKFFDGEDFSVSSSSSSSSSASSSSSSSSFSTGNGKENTTTTQCNDENRDVKVKGSDKNKTTTIGMDHGNSDAKDSGDDATGNANLRAAIDSLNAMSRHEVIQSVMISAADQVTQQFSVFSKGEGSTAIELSGEREEDRLERMRKTFHERYGFSVEVKESSIAGAGKAVFAIGDIPVGSIVAYYPGIAYTLRDHESIPGFPDITEDNEYLIMRYDGTIIDGKVDIPMANLLAAKDNHNSSNKSNRGNKITSMSDYENYPWRRNPHALAHLVNHPGEGMLPNVLGLGLNYPFALQKQGLAGYIPNRYFASPGIADLQWLERPLMRGHALVAIEPIEDGDELLLDYRLHPLAPKPDWYVPVDEEANRRRWGVTV